MPDPVCRICGEPVRSTQPRYGPASSSDGRWAEHWDCHVDVPELIAELRRALHDGLTEVHGDPLPRRPEDD